METENRAKGQATSQLNYIRELVAALSCDYDRLEELRDELANNPDDMLHDMQELASMEAAADAVIDNIHEHPLSVEVRSGWHSVGDDSEPEEFQILLCTGGPAVRIMGELDEYGEPCRAWLEYQDWGTLWTDYYEEGAADVLLTYCQQFYFGS